MEQFKSGRISKSYKFKILKSEIKKWTRKVGLKEEGTINEIMEELNLLERQEGVSGLNSVESSRRNKLNFDLVDRLHMDAIS